MTVITKWIKKVDLFREINAGEKCLILLFECTARFLVSFPPLISSILGKNYRSGKITTDVTGIRANYSCYVRRSQKAQL